MLIRFIVVALFCGVVFGGLVFFNRMRAEAIADYFANQQVPPATVSAAEVTSETWQRYLEAIGTVSAVEGIEVAPQVAGIVEEIAFDANDVVEPGQLLVQLDDAIEQADLALYQAQATLARQTLERVTALRNRGNAADAAYDEARATLEQAEAHLASTRAIIAQKHIVAPFGGTVGIAKINDGQFVGAGDPLVTLQRLDRVHVDFTLPDRAVSEVRIGQEVELEVDAFPERTFVGRVTGIDPRVDSSSRSLAVRATLDNPDGMLLPGIFARVRVVLPEQPEVVTVPQTAITFTLYGDTAYVIEEAERDQGSGREEPTEEPAGTEAAQQPDQPSLVVTQTFVRVGQRRGDVVEILEGLSPGQRVVTSGQLKLQNGAPVVIDNSVDPAQFALGPS